MATVFTLLLIGGVGFIVLISLVVIGERRSAERKQSLLYTIPGFKSSHQFLAGGGNGIAIDYGSRAIAILGQVGAFVYSFDELLEVEAIHDNVTISKVNRASQAGGALVGAALAGPAGLLIGGLSGSRRAEQKATKLILRIYFNNDSSPVQDVVFLNDPTGADAFSSGSQSTKMNDWYGRLAALIKRQNSRPPRDHQESVSKATPPEIRSKGYQVRLISAGKQNVSTLKWVRAAMGADLATAQRLVDNVPSLLLTTFVLEEAVRIQEIVQKSGAVVEIE